MTTVGVCEDDDALRGVLRSALERAGYTVRLTASGAEAVKIFSEPGPDVLVLDIGLPDADGRDVCQALRARGTRAPVLFLSSLDALTDRLSGFRAGGDDFLTKPFALPELLVRLEALLRRAPSAEAGPAVGVTLDPARHALRRNGHEVPLTPTEFRIAGALAAAPGTVVRRQTLITAAWPEGAIVHDNTLDVYVTRLRRKLRQVEATESISAVRGVGYRLR